MGVVAAREVSRRDLHHEPRHETTDQGRHEREPVDDRPERLPRDDELAGDESADARGDRIDQPLKASAVSPTNWAIPPKTSDPTIKIAQPPSPRVMTSSMRTSFHVRFPASMV